MAKIVGITTQGTDKTFEVCLADKCEDSDEHKKLSHREYTFGKSKMTEQAMIDEVKLSAREEIRKLDKPQVKSRQVAISI